MMRASYLSVASFAVIGLALAANPAHAAYGDSDSYISFKGDLNWIEDDNYGAGISTDTDNGYGFNLAYGRHYDNWRAELELGYLTADANTGDLNTWTGLFNAYYDFKNTGWGITPYVGLGIGGARTEFNNMAGGLDGEDWTWAYQATGGVAFNLSKQTALTVEYRYLGGSDADVDGYEINTNSHNLLAGVRYTF